MSMLDLRPALEKCFVSNECLVSKSALFLLLWISPRLSFSLLCSSPRLVVLQGFLDHRGPK